MPTYQILGKNGLTPGVPPRIEAASEKAALDRWAQSAGFVNYAEAAPNGHAKTTFQIPPEEQNRPRAIRTIHEVHIRTATAGLMRFGISPNFDGCLSECRDFARDEAANLNLPVIEIPGVNANLESADFERPAVYIRAIQFDEMDPNETRRFRRW